MTDDDFFDSVPTRPMLGPVFDAEYASECSEGDWIQEGDSVRADGYGGWVHASCARQIGRPVIWK